jgi:hypothetical protein
MHPATIPTNSTANARTQKKRRELQVMNRGAPPKNCYVSMMIRQRAVFAGFTLTLK